MLSDSEKEMFINLKKFMQSNIDNGYHNFYYNDLGWDFKCIDCINAIDSALKQSKEIEELKKQDLSNSKIRDKIRNRIKYLTEYYEKEVKPEMYHWGDFTAEEYYAGIITELKMILFKDCMVDN